MTLGALIAMTLACRSAAHLPAAPNDGRTLVLCPGGALEAYLVGSFNGWAASPPPLTRDAEGRFAGTLTLEPGATRICCELHDADGGVRLAPPLNAPRVVGDDFGGENGVFEVPAPGAEVAR